MEITIEEMKMLKQLFSAMDRELSSGIESIIPHNDISSFRKLSTSIDKRLYLRNLNIFKKFKDDELIMLKKMLDTMSEISTLASSEHPSYETNHIYNISELVGIKSPKSPLTPYEINHMFDMKIALEDVISERFEYDASQATSLN